MRIILFLALLFTLGSAHAVVVTFDNMAPTNPQNCGSFLCESLTTPEGFIIDVYDPQYEGVFIGEHPNAPGNNYASTVSICCGGALRIAHESGRAFDLHSLQTNYYGIGDNAYDGTDSTGGYIYRVSPKAIYGYDENGLNIASLVLSGYDESLVDTDVLNLVFDESWDQVYSVTLVDQVYASYLSADSVEVPAWVDNFSATVVPIPPAFWLLGSALFGLKLFHRSRIARA